MVAFVETLNINILFAGELWTKSIQEYTVILMRKGTELFKLCKLDTVHQNDPCRYNFNEGKTIIDLLKMLKKNYDSIEIKVGYTEEAARTCLDEGDKKACKRIQEWINSGVYKKNPKLQKYNLKMPEEPISKEDMTICNKLLVIAKNNLLSRKMGLFIIN